MIKNLFSFMSPAGQKGRLTVLLFHKVPRIADSLTPSEPNLAQFEKTLDFLEENFNVLPLSEAITSLKRGSLPERSMSITLDDGYSDWLQTVAPALLRRNLPATFFISTEQFSGPALWHERIVSAVRALPDQGAILPFGFGSYSDLGNCSNRVKLILELQERLKYQPLHIRLEEISALEAQAGLPLEYPNRFDSDSVRALHSSGFEIGGHTIRHPILNECTHEEAMTEIGGCREELEAVIRGEVSLFAYPNGRPLKDFNGTHVEMVKACGYKAAVATCNGAANSSSDIYQLPRFSPWGTTTSRMTLHIARNMFVPMKAIPKEESPTGYQDELPVKCLLIANTFPPIHGGSAVVYENLCQYMSPGTIRVLAPKINYLTSEEIPGWREHDALKPYPIDRIPLLRPLMMPASANIFISLYRFLFQDLILYTRVLFAAGRLVRRHKINVVCIGELVAGSWIGIALRRIFGCKLIIYVHGEEVTTTTGGRLHGNRRKDFLLAADKIVAVSSFTCDALTREMGVEPDKLELIQNGVDTTKFSPGLRNEQLVAMHGLEEKKIILTVARLVPRKGIDCAIKAISEVVRSRPDVHYLIVGEGPYKESLKALIQQHDISKFVTLVGMVSDVELIDYFRLCDLFLMPNRTMPDGDTEGFGLVFREANACGKPVIGGRAGGVVEAVIDGQNGLLVDGESPYLIAEAILRVLNDDTLSKRLAENGLALAQNNNTQSVAAQFEKLCTRMLRHA